MTLGPFPGLGSSLAFRLYQSTTTNEFQYIPTNILEFVLLLSNFQNICAVHIVHVYIIYNLLQRINKPIFEFLTKWNTQKRIAHTYGWRRSPNYPFPPEFNSYRKVKVHKCKWTDQTIKYGKTKIFEDCSVRSRSEFARNDVRS